MFGFGCVVLGGGDECCGVADGAGGEDASACEPAQWECVVVGVEDVFPCVPGDECWCGWVDFAEVLPERVGVLCADEFGVCDDEGVCARKGLDGFTEPACGEAAVGEW